MIADAIGMSVSRVNDFVKELEKAKLVEITRRGQGKTNHYKINFVVQKKNQLKMGIRILDFDISKSSFRHTDF